MQHQFSAKHSNHHMNQTNKQRWLCYLRLGLGTLREAVSEGLVGMLVFNVTHELRVRLGSHELRLHITHSSKPILCKSGKLPSGHLLQYEKLFQPDRLLPEACWLPSRGEHEPLASSEHLSPYPSVF